MENTGGFGFSGVNSAGMSWADIAATATSRANNISGSSYGGPITYKGYKYRLDLSQLPSLPTYYRINNDSINLADFVADVCSAGGCDYFIRLIKPTAPQITAGYSGTFKVITISRTTEAVTGKIAQFIENTPCVISKNYGLELRKDVNSKFVVGASVERMYFNYPQDSGDNIGDISRAEYSNDTVLPFFGTDVNNNVIIGYTPSGEPNEYYFNIDISDIIHNSGQGFYNSGEYLTCLSEMRAARKGRDSWERYLCERDTNEYIIDPNPSGNNMDIPATGGGLPRTIEYFKPRFKTTGPKFSFGGPLGPPGQSNPALYNFDYWLIHKYGFEELSKAQNSQRDADGNISYSGRSAELIYKSYPGTTTALTNPTDWVYSNFLKYKAISTKNVYWGRASSLGMTDGIRLTFPKSFEYDLYERSKTHPDLQIIYEKFKTTFGLTTKDTETLNLDANEKQSRYTDSLGNFNDNKVDPLFRKIKGIADSYYNKRFMVSIPFTLGTFEPESNNIRMSQDVISEGFIDESAWATAYSSGLIPDISGINTLITNENKFYPFAKYENCVIKSSGGAVKRSLYDFSEIGQGDKIFSTPVPYTGVGAVSGDNIYDCWVKCGVEERIYFQDTQTLYGPRAIIEVPGSIKKNVEDAYPSFMGGIINMHKAATGVGGVFAADTGVNADFLKKSFDQIGGDSALYHNGEPILQADLYAIPLRSKLLCYGPWYAVGADGKVSYERSTDLNPWNYGGFSAMNIAGAAKVNDGITDQTFSEAGSITVAGAPAFNFGDALIAAGPYVTDISVTFGSAGVTSTYNMQAWSTHKSLSKLTNFAVERNKRIASSVRETQSNFREGLSSGRFKNAGDFYNKIAGRFIDLNDYARRDRPSTSSKIIAGNPTGIGANVVIQPLYNTASQANTDWANKAFMSLDGIYRPVSTIARSGWSSFESPSSTGLGQINSITINPLRVGNDILALSYGSTPHSGGLLRNTGEIIESGAAFADYRGMGFKMPMVGIGWGYDTNDSPVPTGSGGDMRSDYLYNSQHWKTGPIDLRWDNERKVWTGGGASTKIFLSKVTNTYNPSNFSYEVERSNSRDQFTRFGPTARRAFNSSGTLYDPEYLAYSGNPNNVGVYEQLNYAGIEFPQYEAFIIRETVTSVGDEYYNIWSEDCQDCGHVSNPCGSGHGQHGMASYGRKILIENPLKQSLDTGDLCFTVKTGRKKKINTGEFIGGSGTGATGHVSTNASGVGSFVVTAAGSGYTTGGFGIINSGICASLSLFFTSGVLSSGTVNPTGGYSPSRNYSVSIYPQNSTVKTESLDIHWIQQAEFKSQQVVSHVECDGGLLQTCSVKIQTQGFKSCEWCGEDAALVNSF